MPAPDWPPAKPHGFEFTPHRDGWAKWYRGQTRIIPLKTLDRSAVRAEWDRRKADIDAALKDQRQYARRRQGGRATIREAASEYYLWLDHRVATGLPDPLSQVTAADYKRMVNAFGRSAGPDTPLGDLEQSHFATFAQTLAGSAPSTMFRTVATLHAFFNFCVDEGLMGQPPAYGRYFAKPSSQVRRDVRLSVEKSYTPEQIQSLYRLARPEEKLWIILGTCGAMDNADLAHLTHDVLDRQRKLIDYRRRKVGKVRRLIPMPDEFWTLLDAYKCPAPAAPEHAGRVFLTPTGLPLQRMKLSASGRSNPIDYVHMRWVRLLIKAGLRPKMPRRRDKAHRDLPRRQKQRGSAGGQGFRGLRTTFPNLAPPGFRDEVEVIMGHSAGTVLLDHYLEKFGVERLKELVGHVWKTVFAPVVTLRRRRGASSATAGKRAARKWGRRRAAGKGTRGP